MPHRTGRAALAVVALLFSITSADAATEILWGHPQPQGNGIYGLAFLDADQGWAVGGGGTVLATQDGAVSWQLRHGPDLAMGDLNDVLVLPDGTLVAVGNGVWRSTDGGLTWDLVAGPGTGDLRDLTTIPGGAVSAAGTGGRVLVSEDGGLTWDDVGPGVGLVRHHLWRTALEGYAVGEDVSHRTIDGGASWTPITSFTPFGFNEVYFTDAQHGTIVEDFGTWQSDDGGQTWTEFFLPVDPLYRFRTLVLSPAHLIAALFIEGGQLWESTDGGVEWTMLQNRQIVGFPVIVQTPGGRLVWGSDIGDLFWSDDLARTAHNATVNLCEGAPAAPITRFISRPDGVLFAANQPNSADQTQSWLRSSDGGVTWTAPTSTPGLRWIDAGGFVDAAHGLVCYRQWIRRTADGGETWQPAELAANRRIWSAALPAAERWFLATSREGGGGDLVRSDDGGVTWAPVAGGLPTGSFQAGSVVFADAQAGFVSGYVGSAARLYRTLDGGATWQQRAAAGLPGAPSAMHWFDSEVGLATISQFTSPGVYRSTDGGASWTPVQSGWRPLDLVFRDELHGVAVAYYEQSYLVTDDGGLGWTEQSSPFRGPGPGFMTATVNAAAPRADGWVLGGASNRIVVLRDDDLTAVDDGLAANPLPGACRFLGASPNPFNPSTTLALTVAHDGDVRVTIHDARGRRVRVLFAAPLAAGRHDLLWDGRNDDGASLPAGVYLVRVAGTDGSDHGKVVMVK